jgi:hypothetical protein
VTALTPERAAELLTALGAVCQAAGVDPRGAELIKYTNNAVYRLPEAGAVVRLGVGPLAAERAERVTTVARWLATRDAPVVRLLGHLDQPVRLGPYVATFWVELPASGGGEWSGADLAEPLRVLHGLQPPRHVADWNPFTAARHRLEAADGLSSDDLRWLQQQWVDAEEEFRQMGSAVRTGLVHGDAHTGNLLRDRDGRLVLCDLDSTGRGPLDWDLVPTAVGAIRFGRPDRHEELAAAYERDVTESPGWPVLRRIRELTLVTSVITDLRRRPDVAAEHAHRVRTLRADQTAARWHRYR